MRTSHRHRGAYRSLWGWEAPVYAAHLKRLDNASRRRRFHGAVNDGALERHAARALKDKNIRVIGWFKDGVLRGAVEIALIGDGPNPEGEAAFAVEQDFRLGGVGSILMARALLFAKNRGARRVHIATETGNEAMLALASAAGARFARDGWDVDGVVETGERSVFSLGREAVEEEAGVAAWSVAKLARWLQARLGGLRQPA